MEVKSNRERYTERLKAKYPDKEFADDEALFAQINDEYTVWTKNCLAIKNGKKHFPIFLRVIHVVQHFLLIGVKGRTQSSV